MKKGFTLIELVVAIGLLALVGSFAGVIFRAGIETYRVATAEAEIMQKFRAITAQLDADFKGLRKDGEIFIIWAPMDLDPPEGDGIADARFDRIMFFASGDFHSYGQVGGKVVRGNVARITYMLARTGYTPEDKAYNQPPQKRILARTQHILTADEALVGLDLTKLMGFWYEWRDYYEFDKITLQDWLVMRWGNKADILSVITDVAVRPSQTDPSIIESPSNIAGGTVVDPEDPGTIHSLLAEGVGQFKIQGWSDEYGWVPEDNDVPLLNLTGDPTQEVAGILYNPLHGGIKNLNVAYDPNISMDEEHFNQIPGLGRALKFTFTLYDSKGVFKNGRTFTHIVYLDE